MFPIRAVFIDPSVNLIRVGPKGAYIPQYWYFNKDGKLELSKTGVQIPEGYYIGPRHVD